RGYGASVFLALERRASVGASPSQTPGPPRDAQLSLAWAPTFHPVLVTPFSIEWTSLTNRDSSGSAGDGHFLVGHWHRVLGPDICFANRFANGFTSRHMRDRSTKRIDRVGDDLAVGRGVELSRNKVGKNKDQKACQTCGQQTSHDSRHGRQPDFLLGKRRAALLVALGRNKSGRLVENLVKAPGLKQHLPDAASKLLQLAGNAF